MEADLSNLLEWAVYRSKVITYNARSKGYIDIRKVFRQSKADDAELIRYYKKYIGSNPYKNWDKIAIDLARAVNSHLKYKTDRVQYGVQEYWASPIEVHRSRADDCDGHATLIVYLMGLFGIPAYRRFVWAGQMRDGFGHAVAIYWSIKHNTFFTLEGSYKASKSFRNFNKLPLFFNEDYKKMWFATNEQVAYTKNFWRFKFV